MRWGIYKGIEAIIGFNDDQGEPMNENANSFLVMVPLVFLNSALNAVAPPERSSQTAASALTPLQAGVSIDVVANTRLSAWTDRFPVFRTDSEVKALIRQEETAVQLKVKGDGSEYEFDNDAHQYGIDTWRNVGYGYWQNACLVTLT